MKNMYKIFTKFYRIELLCEIFANYTWMCSLRGGGRLEVTNHGRSRVKSFLQETEDENGQQTPRIGVRPKQKSTVQDARDLKSDLPNFLCAIISGFICLEVVKASASASANLDKPENMYLLAPRKNEVRGLDDNSKASLQLNARLDTQDEYESLQVKKAKRKIRDVAELYEKQFLRDMVKQMRSTVGYSEISKPSFAEGYFREQLDQEYVEKWGERGGIGLGDMIYKQLVGQYGSRMGLTSEQPRIGNQ
jgi:hypothetical protein